MNRHRVVNLVGISSCQPFPTSNENNATQKQENISENVTNKEFSQSNFKVYPNPNTGKFEIELNKISPNDLCLIITNASGIVVYSSKSFYKSVINVDISNFPKGIYFVKLFNDSHTYVNKIISY